MLACATIARTARAQQDMSMTTTDVSAPLGVPWSRIGPGTSWLPDDAPMGALHVDAASWRLMLHGDMFGEYDRQSTVHGDTKSGIIDWEMLMATRPLAGGSFRADLMTSVEPLVLGTNGYPELLQSGAVHQNARLANVQHSNHLVMELGAAFDHALTSQLAASFYAAAVGQPAIGPVAYMHRPSAEADPFAPLSHHWQDATHQSAGVATLGLYTRSVKIEGSAFNAREGDAQESNVDYTGARLDSYSGRVTVAPVSWLDVAAWGGYLYGHDPLDPAVGMQQYGASVLTSNHAAFGRPWSSAIVWGLMIHHHGAGHNHADPGAVVKPHHVSSSMLLESSVDVTERLTVFGRAEQIEKSSDDLGFLAGDAGQLFTIRSLSGGVARDFVNVSNVALGVGVRGTLAFLPQTLKYTYTTQTPTGFALYVRIRPARSPNMAEMASR